MPCSPARLFYGVLTRISIGNKLTTKLVASVRARRLVKETVTTGNRKDVKVSRVRDWCRVIRHEAAWLRGRASKAGALRKVFLFGRATVIAGAAIWKDRRHSSAALIPPAWPPGERNAVPSPIEPVIACRISRGHAILLAWFVKRMATHPRLPAGAPAPYHRILDANVLATREDRARFGAG